MATRPSNLIVMMAFPGFVPSSWPRAENEYLDEWHS
jgi:hypothetical protein